MIYRFNHQKIRLPRMAIMITTRCNLKCKYCSVGVPSQKEAYHMSFDEFRQGLDAIFQVIGAVDSLEFGGGEPFLHADLPRMIESYAQYKDRFEQWLVVTNGTVPPSDELIRALERHKENGVLHLSDYNIYPKRTKRLIEILREIGFKYRVDKYYGEDQYQGGWVDPGAMAPRGRTEAELSEVFSRCGLIKSGGCWRLHRGKIHICMRSMRCSDAGFDFPSDYLDVFDAGTAEAQKAAKLRSLIEAPYVTACDYCNGDLGTKDLNKRISAAEQLC